MSEVPLHRCLCENGPSQPFWYRATLLMGGHFLMSEVPMFTSYALFMESGPDIPAKRTPVAANWCMLCGQRGMFLHQVSPRFRRRARKSLIVW